MRIVKDYDGDLWEEVTFNAFVLRTVDEGGEAQTLEYLEFNYGPLEVFGPPGPDTSIYRITYADGRVKHANRKVLGCVRGSGVKLSKVERASQPTWTDVTSEFIKP